MQLLPVYFSAQQNMTCPQGYKYNSDINLCWEFEKGAQLNYFESYERCSQQGAHLMVVNTIGILRFMQEWLASGMIEYNTFLLLLSEQHFLLNLLLLLLLLLLHLLSAH